MRGIWYVIAEVAALLAVSGLIGFAIGWLAGRLRRPTAAVDMSPFTERIELLEGELRLSARDITESEQRAAEAERRLNLAVDRIQRDPVPAAQATVTFDDRDRIERLEQALEEKTGSIAQLEERLADQTERMDQLLERIPAGADDGAGGF
ncbi:MAG: hypothetical protein KJN71_05055 [Acidimicrobiia bacterium]|nr:hypothetical protein [Acidimicrobiia bacterium]NNC73873.1 hypothetical protein [Acidimicrobiia bacterium]